MTREDGEGTGYYVEPDTIATSRQLRGSALVDPNQSCRRSALCWRPARPEGDWPPVAALSTKIEYWDADWWCVVVDGSMAPDFPKKNPYAPRLPYFRAKVRPVCTR
jgi:hypothetical protein